MADITIITPVLNQASTIEACIHSVASQNSEVEHIIIDGGSTDGTIQIIQENEDLISSWISEPDNGQSDAINKGLAMSSGTFFNWLNADDTLTGDALKTVVDLSKSEPDVIIGKCLHVNEKGVEVDIGSAKIWDSLEATLANYSMGQPSVFYRTSVIRSLKGLNKNLHLCMDMDLWFRYLLKFGISNIDSTQKILSRFLVRSDSKSSLQKTEMEAEKYGIYHALLSNFELPKILTEFLSDYAIPTELNYNPSKSLERNELLGHFSWHLLVSAYRSGNLQIAEEWYAIVADSNRLSMSEKMKWKARLASSRLIKK